MAGLLYGGVSYLLFLAAFLYAIGFVGNVLVPKSIDSGPASDAATAVVVDALLLGAFAIQHSGMARQRFKAWWTRLVPPHVERSTFVLSTSLLLFLLYWQWRPIAAPVWTVPPGPLALLLRIASAAGWLLVLVSTFLIDHFDLFGLRQVYLAWRGTPYTPVGFRTPALYRVVRHPIYLGFTLAFWCAPAMTLGHLLFALATTGYMLLAIQLEERDLVSAHGESYRNYQRQVSMILPLPRRRPAGE